MFPRTPRSLNGTSATMNLSSSLSLPLSRVVSGAKPNCHSWMRALRRYITLGSWHGALSFLLDTRISSAMHMLCSKALERVNRRGPCVWGKK